METVTQQSIRLKRKIARFVDIIHSPNLEMLKTNRKTQSARKKTDELMAYGS